MNPETYEHLVRLKAHSLNTQNHQVVDLLGVASALNLRKSAKLECCLSVIESMVAPRLAAGFEQFGLHRAAYAKAHGFTERTVCDSMDALRAAGIVTQTRTWSTGHTPLYRLEQAFIEPSLTTTLRGLLTQRGLPAGVVFDYREACFVDLVNGDGAHLNLPSSAH